MIRISEINPRYSDYLPLVSTDVNFRFLLFKGGLITETHAYTNLNNKSTLRCVTLLVPVFGNLIIYLFDHSLRRNLEIELTEWLADPAASGLKETAVERIRLNLETQDPKLDLSCLNLNSLPNALSQLTYLLELNISDNEFTEFPPQITHLNQLEILYFSDNLYAFDLPSLGALNELQLLDISGNHLTSLPTEMGSKLEKLYLGGNLLNSFAPLANLTNLTLLDLSDNQLTGWPAEIGSLTRLKELQIHNNELTAVGKEIGRLTNLRELYLSDNRLTSLPSEIGGLCSLTNLDLENNELTTFPLELVHLTQLKEIELNKNKIVSLPAQIGALINLKRIHLTSNLLTAIPQELCRLSKLEELYLSDNALTFLPSEIENLTSLSDFVINNNNLATLPGQIWKLTRLNSLYVGNNRLTSLPAEIGRLTSLTELDLSGNFFSSLPTEVGNLTHLKNLILNSNQIAALPTQIGLLTNLELLYSATNALTSLPTEMGNLIKLQLLHLFENAALNELPLSLGQLPQLQECECSQTGIDPNCVRLILNQCQLMHEEEAVNILPGRLAKWLCIAECTVNLNVELLSKEQKIDLNEWLLRLERTSDFAKAQKLLARSVSRILIDAFHHAPFQELFFTAVRTNNVCCQDRTAMSLNEIYTSWRILCSSENEIEMMRGVAKTVTLRKEIAKRLAERKKIEAESVEIYLYYETHLKKKLNLVTAIHSMNHAVIGKRAWIDEERLIRDVNSHYFEELFELPIFQKVLLQDNSIQKKWREIDAEYSRKLESLGERPQGSPVHEAVLNYQWRQGEIMQEWKRTKMALANIWLSQK